MDDGTNTVRTRKQKRPTQLLKLVPPPSSPFRFLETRLKSAAFHGCSPGLKQSSYCATERKASMAFNLRHKEKEGGGGRL